MSSISFSIKPQTTDCQGAYDLIRAIKADTKPEEFLKELEKFPNYKLNKSITNSYFESTTLLHHAARLGNIALIELIVKIGGVSLLTLEDTKFNTPLHSAINFCKKERKYFTISKLIELGTPINIVHKQEVKVEGGVSKTIYHLTPFELALKIGNLKIAAFLQVIGGIIPPLNEMDFSRKLENESALKKLKKEKTIDNIVLFYKGFNLRVLPKEIVNQISTVGMKLALL